MIQWKRRERRIAIQLENDLPMPPAPGAVRTFQGDMEIRNLARTGFKVSGLCVEAAKRIGKTRYIGNNPDQEWPGLQYQPFSQQHAQLMITQASQEWEWDLL